MGDCRGDKRIDESVRPPISPSCRLLGTQFRPRFIQLDTQDQITNTAEDWRDDSVPPVRKRLGMTCSVSALLCHYWDPVLLYQKPPCELHTYDISSVLQSTRRLFRLVEVLFQAEGREYGCRLSRLSRLSRRSRLSRL